MRSEQTSSRYEALFDRYSSPLEPIPTGVTPRLPLIDSIDTILFDVYGTLVISDSGDIGNLNNAAVATGEETFRRMANEELGLSLPHSLSFSRVLNEEIRHEHERARRRGIPWPEVEIREIWRRVLADCLGAAPPPEITEKAALLYELATNRVWPMPGALEILTMLAEHYRLGIVSNAQFYTLPMLRAFFGGRVDLFDPGICVWSFQEGRAKPDPELFRKILVPPGSPGSNGGIRPSHTLFVGNDMLNDIQAAGAAGIAGILFAGDRRSLRFRRGDPRFTGDEAAGIVTELTQITSVLGVQEVSL